MNSENRPISSPRLFEQILENIKALIISEHLSHGDRLPSERDLADRFGVSRVPVREALKILEYLGILDGTKGSGFYVRDVQLNDIFNKVNFAFVATSKTVREMMEVRISLESQAAYYAAQRRDDDDILAMQECLNAMRSLKRDSADSEACFEGLREQSGNFHMAIIHAAKNSVLEAVYISLLDMLQVSRRFTFAGSDISNNALLAHEAIFEKICSGKAESAQICMSEHLSEAQEVFMRTLVETESCSEAELS